MDLLYIVLAAVAGAVIGFGLHFAVSKKANASAEIETKKIKEEAIKEAGSIITDANLQAKEIIFDAKKKSEDEAKERFKEVLAAEKRILQREDLLDEAPGFPEKIAGFVFSQFILQHPSQDDQ